jgi:hypothetical protein
MENLQAVVDVSDLSLLRDSTKEPSPIDTFWEEPLEYIEDPVGESFESKAKPKVPMEKQFPWSEVFGPEHFLQGDEVKKPTAHTPKDDLAESARQEAQWDSVAETWESLFGEPENKPNSGSVQVVHPKWDDPPWSSSEDPYFQEFIRLKDADISDKVAKEIIIDLLHKNMRKFSEQMNLKIRYQEYAETLIRNPHFCLDDDFPGRANLRSIFDSKSPIKWDNYSLLGNGITSGNKLRLLKLAVSQKDSGNLTGSERTEALVKAYDYLFKYFPYEDPSVPTSVTV